MPIVDRRFQRHHVTTHDDHGHDSATVSTVQRQLQVDVVSSLTDLEPDDQRLRGWNDLNHDLNDVDHDRSADEHYNADAALPAARNIYHDQHVDHEHLDDVDNHHGSADLCLLLPDLLRISRR